MGLNFRKRIKILPGVALNISKRGISSISLGTKGATLNISKKGTKSTVGIPGTGFSYSSTKPYIDNSQNYEEVGRKKVSILLFIGIFIMPYIFSWILLDSGYSRLARIIGFSWLVLFLLLYFMGL